MKKSGHLISDIEASIARYKDSLLDFRAQLESVEDDLGGTLEKKGAENLKKIQDSIENKIQSIEQIIFSLELKKTEFEFLNSDNFDKNKLALYSLWVNGVLTFVLVILTFFQVISNRALVEIEKISISSEASSAETALNNYKIQCLNFTHSSYRKDLKKLEEEFLSSIGLLKKKIESSKSQ